MIAGKHAVVTGGATGIGAAIARALKDAGARVSIVSRSPCRVEDAYAYACADVGDETAVARAFAACREAYGAIGILVNNAGIAQSAPFVRTERTMWDGILATNLTGTFVCTRAVAAEMLAARWGRIVNIASTAGLYGGAYVAAYCASKHGVIGLTRALAAEWATTGVTVNAVCPGYTETAMLQRAVAAIIEKTGATPEAARAQLAGTNPRSRIVTPEEVAEAVVALCAGRQNGAEIILPA
jgi:3-hydroxybutyrate dehydrogenase